MYEPAFNRAILPLLESGDVDALEWSFDTVADHATLPVPRQSRRSSSLHPFLQKAGITLRLYQLNQYLSG